MKYYINSLYFLGLLFSFILFTQAMKDIITSKNLQSWKIGDPKNTQLEKKGIEEALVTNSSILDLDFDSYKFPLRQSIFAGRS